MSVYKRVLGNGRVISGGSMELLGQPDRNEIVDQAKSSHNVKVFFNAESCKLSIGPGCVLENLEIYFSRPKQVVSFEGNNTVRGWIYMNGPNSSLRVGADTRTSNTFWANVSEQGSRVTIGSDCLFAYCKFRTSDSHPIFDLASGERINPPGDIVVGDHVWLAEDVIILRGSSIGSGSVIGARSIVTGDIPANSLAVGTPARVVRSGIRWQP